MGSTRQVQIPSKPNEGKQSLLGMEARDQKAQSLKAKDLHNRTLSVQKSLKDLLQRMGILCS